MPAEDKSQKTEKPTPKHKREAKKEGRVARSAEIGSWFSLGVVVLAFPSLGAHAVSQVSGFMSLAANAMPANDPAQSVSLLGRGLWTVVEAVGPILVAVLPSSWSNPINKYWPTEASGQLVEVTRQAHSLSAWWGAGEMALFVAVLFSVAGYLLSTRDA